MTELTALARQGLSRDLSEDPACNFWYLVLDALVYIYIMCRINRVSSLAKYCRRTVNNEACDTFTDNPESTMLAHAMFNLLPLLRVCVSSRKQA